MVLVVPIHHLGEVRSDQMAEVPVVVLKHHPVRGLMDQKVETLMIFHKEMGNLAVQND